MLQKKRPPCFSKEACFGKNDADILILMTLPLTGWFLTGGVSMDLNTNITFVGLVQEADRQYEREYTLLHGAENRIR